MGQPQEIQRQFAFPEDPAPTAAKTFVELPPEVLFLVYADPTHRKASVVCSAIEYAQGQGKQQGYREIALCTFTEASLAAQSAEQHRKAELVLLVDYEHSPDEMTGLVKLGQLLAVHRDTKTIRALIFVDSDEKTKEPKYQQLLDVLQRFELGDASVKKPHPEKRAERMDPRFRDRHEPYSLVNGRLKLFFMQGSRA